MARATLPLHQIAAFEAALRHLSFSRAADELNVQQPAIGRQVAALENRLGVRLFHRTKPRLTLTEEGELLARSVSKGFETLRSGIAELEAHRSQTGIVVNAAIGFTSFYLLPTMAGFQAQYREIPVQIVTRDQNPDFDASLCDAVVVFGEHGLPGQPTGLVARETIVAICKKGYLPGDRKLRPEELANQKLLHMAGASHVGDWERFFSGSGAVPPVPPKHDRYHSFMVYMRAIQNGLGIGIGWRPLVDDFLASETLVLACDLHRQTNRGYFCSLTPRGSARPDAQQFLSWLCPDGSSDSHMSKEPGLR